jgi:predicted alpha/beta-fold hydrolase
MSEYSPAWWLPGAHAQTMWGKLFRRLPPQSTKRVRLDTPDGDFVDLHRLPSADQHAPRLLILHGLEGTVRSHYAQGLLAEAARREWAADLLIFRSCGDELNLTRRFYHSGETADLAFVIDHILSESPTRPLVAAGVSLGGNVLLKYLGERNTSIAPQLKAAVGISVPYDLARSSRHIDRGFAKLYQRHFIRSLKRKTAAKLERFPDLVDRDELSRIRTMYEFDETLTGPLHGFSGADDYYSRSSSLGWLNRISIPTLLFNAVDDPFMPPDVLTDVRAVAAQNPALEVEFPPHGGHAGFIAGSNPFRPFYHAEQRACEFLAGKLEQTIALPTSPASVSR